MDQLTLDLPELDLLDAPPDLASYHRILINISAGKDSQAALDAVVKAAKAAAVADRLVAVHADLGPMEWPGVRELAAEHAAHYNLRFEVVRRNGSNLLERIKERGMFPDSQNRWCTSDFKRGPVRTLMTRLVREVREEGISGRVRLLNVMGMRAQESPARRRLLAFSHDGSKTCSCEQCRTRTVAAAAILAAGGKVPKRLKTGHGASNSLRHVDTWLPIHGWTTAQVWERIGQAGTRPHMAYLLGMPRLSCVFCVLASRSALILAAQLQPELAALYAEAEAATGHRFRQDLSMAEIIAEAATRRPVRTVEEWAA
ncbi:phosphoadenosine phosphosulfate reductase domain-containing protein [Nonomuraea helvata]|uniref:Phosphoadenosine phosphosulfate reductase family protein n=1 Tax=Nonomuraea helvata TaxID=37484 RepID=A0ABV5S5Y6_9ACTN